MDDARPALTVPTDQISPPCGIGQSLKDEGGVTAPGPRLVGTV